MSHSLLLVMHGQGAYYAKKVKTWTELLSRILALCWHINIPPLDELINISAHQLHELKNTTGTDPDDDSDNPTANEDSPPHLPDGDKD